MYTINFEVWPTPIAAHKGTVLDAALSQGIPYPHQCRVGECGNCKSRLLSGNIKHDPCLPDVLTDEEKDRGLILACRARPQSDINVSWKGATDNDMESETQATSPHPIREIPSRIDSIDLVSPEVTRLGLSLLGEPLVFSAGQYLRLSVGSLPSRSFSMANAADPNGCASLEFHIKHVRGGQVSPFIANRLKVNHAVSVEGPFGIACLENHHDGPIVALAGGTGIAPMLSIVNTVFMLGTEQPVHLYWSLKKATDVYALPELELLMGHPMIKVHILLTEESGIPGFREGRIHQALAADFHSLSGTRVYTAGPPNMVKSVKETSLALGASPSHIHCDAFTPSGLEPASVSMPREKPSLLRRLAWLGARFK